MAPEQLEHPQDVDQRADIYSLGVVFYEMLTGELPIGRFAPPSEKSAVDPRVDEVVLRALEKERERRTQSAGEVKTQVETIAATPEQQKSGDRKPRIGAPEAEWEGRAPGWRIRCRTCGFTEHWGKYGIRMGAVGRNWTLGRCAHCGRWRIHVIEKGPVSPVQPVESVRSAASALPRFSRTAIVGSVLGAVVLARRALVPVSLFRFGRARRRSAGTAWWHILLLVTLLPLGLSALRHHHPRLGRRLANPPLGGETLRDVAGGFRRSVFPTARAWRIRRLVLALGILPRHPRAILGSEPPHGPVARVFLDHWEGFVVLCSVATLALAGALIVIAVWRAVNRPLPTPAARPASPRSPRPPAPVEAAGKSPPSSSPACY